ncbi:hypothetical protein EST38_g4902 [Candolleomyces aberdarensis]|uniref:Uncharacterized protein n=1 Tax=Candolleomyces aberdarensis TaxID=2316362 RepID=A0A4Q2DP67_9AGAR|nr:hypothetical protein EST38_g4902 [Candolleomyces aberdarensis]
MSVESGLPRVAVLDDYQSLSIKLADWYAVRDKVSSIDVFTDTLHDEDALVERLAPYQIVSAMRERTKFPASLIDRLPNLKLIATTGFRNLGIDSAHAWSKGIVVSGTGAGGNSTLEHIWALLLATVRSIVVEDRNIKNGNPQWQNTLPLGLSGRTLGLIGIAKLFNLRVIGWSPHFTPERAEAAGVEYIPTKSQLLRESDIVSLHIVLSASTRHILSRDDLALLKPTSFLINTSRGPLVDEAALIDVLREGKIAGAGLDVYDIEPLPLDHPIRTLKNVTLSPHSAYLSDTNFKVFYEQTVENILAFLEGKPIRVYE